MRTPVTTTIGSPLARARASVHSLRSLIPVLLLGFAALLAQQAALSQSPPTCTISIGNPSLPDPDDPTYMPLDLGLERNNVDLSAAVTDMQAGHPPALSSVVWTTTHGKFVEVVNGTITYVDTTVTLTDEGGLTGAVLSVDDRDEVECTVTATCLGAAGTRLVHFIPDIFPTGDVTQANAPYGVAVGAGRTLPVVFSNSTLPNPWPWPAADPIYHINRPPNPGVRLKVGVGPMDGIRDLAYGSVGVTDVVTDANGQVKLT